MKAVKTVSVLLALCFAFVMIFSCFFLAFENGHVCSGEDCFVCLQMSFCRQIIKTAGSFTALILSVCFAFFFFCVYCKDNEALIFINNPVSLKVKKLC